MATQRRRRRGTTAQHATFTGAGGEITIDTDKNTVVVHDATTPGGHPLAKETDTATALANRVRADAAQAFTAAQQGRARGNIGADILAGFRNKIINGNFDVWQRATTQSIGGYASEDRWSVGVTAGSTITNSRLAMNPGSVELLRGDRYSSRMLFTGGAGASDYVNKIQPIENVHTLQGKKATLTFYAKTVSGADKNIAPEVYQHFGSGGSPSAGVSTPLGLFLVTGSWQRFDVIVDVPSTAGKTLGTNGNDALWLAFWYSAGSTFSARSSAIGQQSGDITLARISLVEGDATAEADPFSARHPGIEMMLCQRYYQVHTRGSTSNVVYGYAIRPDTASNAARFWVRSLMCEMRTTPTVTNDVTLGGSGGTINTVSADSKGFIIMTDSVAAASAITWSGGSVKLDAEL